MAALLHAPHASILNFNELNFSEWYHTMIHPKYSIFRESVKCGHQKPQFWPQIQWLSWHYKFACISAGRPMQPVAVEGIISSSVLQNLILFCKLFYSHCVLHKAVNATLTSVWGLCWLPHPRCWWCWLLCVQLPSLQHHLHTDLVGA